MPVSDFAAEPRGRGATSAGHGPTAAPPRAPPRLGPLRRVCGPLSPVLPHAAGTAALAGFAPAPAWAHVKWFAPYDVTRPPVPIEGVFTPHFLAALAGFALLVSGGFLLDRLVARSGHGIAGSQRREEAAEKVLRAGVGAFFVALFATGGTILTPELHTEAVWPAWLQFGIAAGLLWTRTCVLGGLGILVLYGHAMARYGVFHLADYPMFLGLAAYLALTSTASARLRALRMPILYASVCTGLMWAGIEKWAYPQWTFPLLDARPYLTLGVPPGDFMVLAGFVEFALAFYILTGLGLLRLGLFALCAIFVVAILDFGKLDAIGHLPTIAALVAMFLHGPTPLHRRLHGAGRGLLVEGRRAGVSFAAAVCLFFAAYYGLQHTEHRDATDARGPVTLAARTGGQAR